LKEEEAVANLTIAIDDETLKQARLRAVEQGTSVNAILRDYLRDYAGLTARRQKALKALIRLSRHANASHGGRRWTRDELHER
jgi:plasmid stability protein